MSDNTIRNHNTLSMESINFAAKNLTRYRAAREDLTIALKGEIVELIGGYAIKFLDL
jgi:hypothetical protein